MQGLTLWGVTDLENVWESFQSYKGRPGQSAGESWVTKMPLLDAMTLIIQILQRPLRSPCLNQHMSIQWWTGQMNKSELLLGKSVWREKKDELYPKITVRPEGGNMMLWGCFFAKEQDD